MEEDVFQRALKLLYERWLKQQGIEADVTVKKPEE